MLTPLEVEHLAARIAARIQPVRIVLFGSYAKGTPTTHSDLDLLVIRDTPLPMINRANDLRPIVSQFLVHVDVQVYTPEEIEEYGNEPGSFVHSVLTTGKTLYERAP